MHGSASNLSQIGLLNVGKPSMTDLTAEIRARHSFIQDELVDNTPADQEWEAGTRATP